MSPFRRLIAFFDWRETDEERAQRIAHDANLRDDFGDTSEPWPGVRSLTVKQQHQSDAMWRNFDKTAKRDAR